MKSSTAEFCGGMTSLFLVLRGELTCIPHLVFLLSILLSEAWSILPPSPHWPTIILLILSRSDRSGHPVNGDILSHTHRDTRPLKDHSPGTNLISGLHYERGRGNESPAPPSLRHDSLLVPLKPGFNQRLWAWVV